MEPTAQPPLQPNLAPQPAMPPAAPQPPMPPAPAPGHNHKRLTIIVVTAIVIIVGGLIVYLVAFASKDSGKNSPATTTFPVLDNQQEANNVKRKTDINALQAQIEAFQAQNGYYPTLANINDSTWRAANMKGLDDTALQDPDGTSKTVVATPTAHSYSYEVKQAGCDNTAATEQCRDYTLTATLSDNSTYVKQALN